MGDRLELEKHIFLKLQVIDLLSRDILFPLGLTVCCLCPQHTYTWCVK